MLRRRRPPNRPHNTIITFGAAQSSIIIDRPIKNFIESQEPTQNGAKNLIRATITLSDQRSTWACDAALYKCR